MKIKYSQLRKILKDACIIDEIPFCKEFLNEWAPKTMVKLSKIALYDRFDPIHQILKDDEFSADFLMKEGIFDIYYGDDNWILKQIDFDIEISPEFIKIIRKHSYHGDYAFLMDAVDYFGDAVAEEVIKHLGIEYNDDPGRLVIEELSKMSVKRQNQALTEMLILFIKNRQKRKHRK